MTQREEQLVEWAVGTLKEEPAALPEGFLARFESKLSQEPAPAPVLDRSSQRTPHWSRSLMAAVLMLAALAAFYWWGPKGPEDGTPGEILIVSTLNQVSLSSEAVSQVQELTLKAPLVTGPDSEAVLLAGGPGNEITLGPDSSLSLSRSSRSGDLTSAELELNSGSVFVAETRTKISIRTPHAHIRPIGTEYEVRHLGDATIVSVLEGRVAVKEPAGRSTVTLESGERLVVGPKSRWKELRPRRLEARELGPMQRYRHRPRLKDRPLPGSALRSRAQPQARVKPDYPKAKPQPRRFRRSRRVSPPVGSNPTAPRATRHPRRQQVRARVQQHRPRTRTNTGQRRRYPPARRPQFEPKSPPPAARQNPPRRTRQIPAYRPTRNRTDVRRRTRPTGVRNSGDRNVRPTRQRPTRRNMRLRNDPTQTRRGTGKLDLTRKGQRNNLEPKMGTVRSGGRSARRRRR